MRRGPGSLRWSGGFQRAGAERLGVVSSDRGVAVAERIVGTVAHGVGGENRCARAPASKIST